MTGSLQIKNGIYYAVLNCYQNGKRRQKWINSNLPEKGNKTRAEKFLREQIALYEREELLVSSDMLFSNYVRRWLQSVKLRVDTATFQGYEILANTQILPYFDETALPLQKISIETLQAYFDEKAQKGRCDGKGGLSARSLKLHKNIISQSLDEAVKEHLLLSNPCQYVILPPVQRREPSFYSADQMDEFLKAIKNEPLFLLIKMTAFYGLRRSEILGLQWNSVNFDNNSFTVTNTVVRVATVIEKNKTKNASSYRSFPLIPEIREALLDEKQRQEENRLLFGKAYYNSPYIFVWNDGRRYAPDYITQTFPKLLKRYGFPRIRFHDLRHSCASILLSKGYNLKDVQEWLGHSDIKMTVNIKNPYEQLKKSKQLDYSKAINL